jgi:hypothetical protein
MFFHSVHFEALQTQNIVFLPSGLSQYPDGTVF